MPGLKQLEQFRDELEALGNEVSIRAQRGEPADILPLPAVPDTPTVDGSADFDPIASGSGQSAFEGDAGEPNLDDIIAAEAGELSLSSETASDAVVEPDFDLSALDTLLNPDTSSDAGFSAEDDFNIPEDLLSGFSEDIQNSPADGDDEDAVSEFSGTADDFSIPDVNWNSLGGMDIPADEDGLSDADDLSDFTEMQNDTPESELPESFEQPDDMSADFTLPDHSDSADTVAGPSGTAEEISLNDFSDFGDASAAFSDGVEPSIPSGFEMPDISAFSGMEDETAELEELKDDQSGFSDDFDIPEIPANVLFMDEEESKAEKEDSKAAGADEFIISGFSDFAPDGTASDISVLPVRLGTKVSGKRDFTDQEYEFFLKNLDSYPLNLRIAVEQIIAGGDYKDDVIESLVRMIIGTPRIRELATKVEKILDKSINIPRDYEKRTASQYETSKASLSYKLLNQILPIAIMGIIVCALTIFLVYLGNRFIYRPLKAESLYEQGYTLLDDGYYSQSLTLFDEADSYKSKKNWYFKYARGYRDKRQYIMAEEMYERLLRRFDDDKAAGLEYAAMESQVLLNYEKAEEIVKRRVLDNYINDRDGMLLLGDIYMDWAQDKDSSKYEKARQTYATLIQLYGNTDLYLSRMLRYFIRTDNLAEVLPLKAYFFPKKKALGASDLTELSGYLLDKLYASPGGKDEYLLPYIEDVRALLEMAVAVGPDIPEAHYNLARYYIHADNRPMAKIGLEKAIAAFDAVPVMTVPRVIRNIDTYRLLGELYASEQEYLKAEESYVAGIRFFENEKGRITKDERIGRLFADLADIDYFISGDLDQSQLNYTRAIEESFDTPQIRYHIGYIQYQNKAYDKALESFIKTVLEKPSDEHALLALGNVLYRRGDVYAAQGYYERLLGLLDTRMVTYGILLPQMRSDQGELVELYMNTSNNLGVALYRQALQTGNSRKNAEALVCLTDSMRAWDALTRNPETMIRLAGSNLAAENLKYITHPASEFQPEIYGKIPQTLLGEKVLKQSGV